MSTRVNVFVKANELMVNIDKEIEHRLSLPASPPKCKPKAPKKNRHALHPVVVRPNFNPEAFGENKLMHYVLKGDKRARLSMGFEMLRSVIPLDKPKPYTKQELLIKAQEYIKDLKDLEVTNKEQKALLSEQQRELWGRLTELRMRLPISKPDASLKERHDALLMPPPKSKPKVFQEDNRHDALLMPPPKSKPRVSQEDNRLDALLMPPPKCKPKASQENRRVKRVLRPEDKLEASRVGRVIHDVIEDNKLALLKTCSKMLRHIVLLERTSRRSKIEVLIKAREYITALKDRRLFYEEQKISLLEQHRELKYKLRDLLQEYSAEK